MSEYVRGADRGGKNKVFHDGNAPVVKLNNFEYAGNDLENFFIRIIAHNKFLGNIPYQIRHLTKADE